MEKQVRKIQGRITKISNSNTVKVRVETKKSHPLYGKTIRTHKSYLVHVPADFAEIKVGDLVSIAESRPISKMKHWVLASIDNK